jgi:hypothetical protein
MRRNCAEGRRVPIPSRPVIVRICLVPWSHPIRAAGTTLSTASPTCSLRRAAADLLEVVPIVRDDGSELAIHAMKMRPMYGRLLPGG